MVQGKSLSLSGRNRFLTPISTFQKGRLTTRLGIYRRQKGVQKSWGTDLKKMNTDPVAAVRGAVPVTERDSAAVRFDVPTTTLKDAEGRIVTPFIEAPLPDVATHIIQPIAVRFLLTYTMCLASTIPVVPTYFI